MNVTVYVEFIPHSLDVLTPISTCPAAIVVAVTAIGSSVPHAVVTIAITMSPTAIWLFDTVTVSVPGVVAATVNSRVYCPTVSLLVMVYAPWTPD